MRTNYREIYGNTSKDTIFIQKKFAKQIYKKNTVKID